MIRFTFVNWNPLKAYFGKQSRVRRPYSIIQHKGGFQKMQQKCDIGGQNSNYEYTNETYAIYCGNIVFSEFSKFLAHMSHIFLRKLIFQLFFNMNSVIKL